MKRLDFVLPDFTRLMWVSDHARSVWEPRLKRVNQAWSRVEWLSVVSGVRPCGLTVATPEKFVGRAAEWVKRGLSALPVEIQGLSNYSYASTPVKTQLGSPFEFRIVLGTPHSVSEFEHAWEGCDHEEMGRLLGFPRCCAEFFHKVWVEKKLVDTTWSMAASRSSPWENGTVRQVAGSPEANILWRWMGIRAVPHLPCDFECKESAKFGRELLEVGRAAGYEEEMNWLLEILSWPVEWSALHGIAEIRTPILKVSTRSDATALKYIVRRPGRSYPAEGAKGLEFPYRSEIGPMVQISLPKSRQALSDLTETLEGPADWHPTDNGFESTAAMDAAHKPILDLVVAALAGRTGRVLDLGCGNGALLQKIQRAISGIEPFGIDVDPSRIARARELLSANGNSFKVGDMFERDADWLSVDRYALAILMPGRLIEAGPARAGKLTAWLAQSCDRLLVYAYGDWLTRHGGLKGLADKAGIRLLGWDQQAPAAFATTEET